jgi:hypothetical protein
MLHRRLGTRGKVNEKDRAKGMEELREKGLPTEQDTSFCIRSLDWSGLVDTSVGDGARDGAFTMTKLRGSIAMWMSALNTQLAHLREFEPIRPFLSTEAHAGRLPFL